MGIVQEEQITRNILASWQVQRSMHSEVKKVLEVAKRKKRNERVVRLVDAAANGDVAEVSLPASFYFTIPSQITSLTSDQAAVAEDCATQRPSACMLHAIHSILFPV